MDPRPFRLVLVTQEAARSQELLRAVAGLPRRLRDRLSVEAFHVDELDSDPERAARAAAAADVLLASHVLVDAAADRVLALVAELRPDAHVVAINSLLRVLCTTRLGDLRLDGAEAPAFLRGLLDGEDLTRPLQDLLRRLPPLLARVPDEQRDLRAWLEVMLYWRDPSPANLRHLALMLAGRFGPAPEAFAGTFEPPRVEPAVGLYHPETGVVADPRELPERSGDAGVVGVLLMRGAVLAGDTAAYDAFVRLLELRGFRVVPVFAESFDFREPVERWLRDPAPDALVSLSGFPLVGGHNRLQVEESTTFLGDLGIPYLTPPALMTQPVERWRRSRLGLGPVESALQLAVHELEGGIEPIVVQGPRGPTANGPRELLEERARRLADRLEGWVRLRRKPDAEKRVLITVFSFPPGKGAVGTAAYLDVFRSARRILARLAEEGWAVRVPETPEELLHAVVDGGMHGTPADAGGLAVGARLSVPDYERITPEWRRAVRLFGPPPGDLDTDGRDLLVHGVELGNAFVGVQPSFGFEGDPMRLLFDPAATPHHGFLAFYRWAEEVFRADVIVHLGTHGALEFMPGKQSGLSGDCWPDVLAGRTPNVYVYAVNNPSEATIAKRRGNAVTIGHLTPPADQAGLTRDLEELRRLLDGPLSATDPERRATAAEALAAKARELHLDADVPPPRPGAGPDAVERWVTGLSAAIKEIESRRIPIGLHVVGRVPEPAEQVEVLAGMAMHDRAGDAARGLPSLLLAARGIDPDAVLEGARKGEPADVARLLDVTDDVRRLVGTLVAEGAAAARDAALALGVPRDDDGELERILGRLEESRARLLASDELGPLVAALGGRYVPPGPGGDPSRNPDVLPVGRNLHALDPASVPSEAALAQAARTVETLLARRRAELGRWPRRIGMVLWGLDNIKTQGEGIAQAFLLMGVRPARNSIGRIERLEVVPLEELGRPRIDVTISASGIFRDIFDHHLALLDRAVRTVAALDEDPEWNHVRATVLELAARGIDARRATTRVFSNAPGAYGTHVDHMVALSSWSESAELAGMFGRRKGFAFTSDEEGADAHDVLDALAAGIDTTFQNLDSHEVSLCDVDHYFEYLGGLSALVRERSGRAPAMLVADGTGAAPRVRTLEEAVRLESRTKLLNPKWREGLLRHGFEGVEEIRKRLDYTFGWSATVDGVDPWVYREAHQSLVDDEAVRERLRGANPHAFAGLVRRLVEADRRGFWEATDAERRRLGDLEDALEDALEGVSSP